MKNDSAFAHDEHHSGDDPHHKHEHDPERTYDIIVNGRRKVVHSADVSFEQALKLAYDPVPTGPTIAFTVTYRHAAHNRQGSLLPHQSVEITNGTVFDVERTDKS